MVQDLLEISRSDAGAIEAHPVNVTELVEHTVGMADHQPPVHIADEARDALVLGEDGLPDVFEQDGWRIEFPAWQLVDELPMPRTVKLSEGAVDGRMAIHRWRLEARAGS